LKALLKLGDIDINLILKFMITNTILISDNEELEDLFSTSGDKKPIKIREDKKRELFVKIWKKFW
jgi:hypothetical protein